MQIRPRYQGAETCGAGSNDGCGVNSGRIVRNEFTQAVRKDSLRERQEQRATKRRAEHDESHGRRNLRWRNAVLHGDYRHLQRDPHSSAEEDLISDPFTGRYADIEGGE